MIGSNFSVNIHCVCFTPLSPGLRASWQALKYLHAISVYSDISPNHPAEIRHPESARYSIYHIPGIKGRKLELRH
jgi:hypothetical protein